MQLAALLDQARQAPPDHRIEWRDRIVPYGTQAIEAVRPWLASPALAAFAVRVIERAGEGGHGELAARVLRAARRQASPPIRHDIAWALARIRAAQRTPPNEPKELPSMARPVAREGLFFSPVARRRAR
jgi:hypothetical protein